MRSNIILKIFALLLFTVEFLAPSFVVGFSSAEISTEKVTLASPTQLQNPLFTLFVEELYENEEDKEFDRNYSVQGQLILLLNCQHIFESSQTALRASFNIPLQFDTHPPLFLVHRKLII